MNPKTLQEWGVMEFIGPKLALWQTKSRWLPFQAVLGRTEGPPLVEKKIDT